MNDNGFIFLLSLGASLLVGIVAVAHVSSRNLSKRIANRRAQVAAKEPEFDFDDLHGDYGYAGSDIIEPVMHAGGGGRRF